MKSEMRRSLANRSFEEKIRNVGELIRLELVSSMECSDRENLILSVPTFGVLQLGTCHGYRRTLKPEGTIRL